MGIRPGEKAPDFRLEGVDGNIYGLGSFKDKKLVAVIFTCNHCPYAQAYQDRIIRLQKEFSDDLAVAAINPNDASEYPEDDFKHMKQRAKEKGYNFSYLRDETQETARKYGAEVTPDAFLLDGKRVLRYRGRIDDNWENPAKVTQQDLKTAILALLDGKDVSVERKAIGCSVKWKSQG